MEADLDKIILGIVYSRFDLKGPEPISWYPELDFTQLERIALKSITLLAGSEGLVSNNVAVIPFPKMHLNAVIYFFEIPVEGVRGNRLDGAISILINQKYLSVFYKNMEMFNQIAQASIEEIKLKYPDKCITEVQTIYNNLKELIYRLYEQERVKELKLETLELEPRFNYKITVVGEPAVGKTTLLLKYMDCAFRELYIPTIGVQVSTKNVMLDNGELAKLTFWDVAGQQMFGNLRKRFYIGSMGTIFVYDVTRPETFEKITEWWEDVNSVFRVKVGCLVANKMDLEVKVDKNKAIELAKKLDLTFIETSAKTGLNVEFLFKKIAQSVFKLFC